MTVKPRLYAPGPVEVPPEVLAALARPVLHHRSREFRDLLSRVRESLADVFRVQGDDVIVVTGSGSAAFEAALLATVPAGGDVLCLHSGRFGVRWAELARHYRFAVTEFAAEAGAEYDLEALDRALRGHSSLAAVTVGVAVRRSTLAHQSSPYLARPRQRHGCPMAATSRPAVSTCDAAIARSRAATMLGASASRRSRAAACSAESKRLSASCASARKYLPWRSSTAAPTSGVCASFTPAGRHSTQ